MTARSDRYNHDIETAEDTEDEPEDPLFHSFSSCSPRYSKKVYSKIDELHEVSLDLYTKPISSFSTFLFIFLYSFYCLVKCNVHKSPFSINKFHKIVLQKFEMTCHKKKKTKHNFMIDNHAIIIISYKKK